tara:strand:+ start:7 stop:846 length:840 start_codon:yes stop_codon:yes gene_type:complete
MGYIGNQQSEGFSSVPAKQDFTNITGTSLTLSHAVASAEGIDLFINNVRQEPTTAYSIAGDGVTVTLTGSVVATDDIYVVYNSLALQTTTPPDASVSTAKIIDGAVTDAKISAMAASKLTGALPAIDGSALTNVVPSLVGFGVRGMSSVTTISSYGAAFRFALSWHTTDVNQGGLLHANGYGLVPSGQAGVYQISYFANYGSVTNYMQITLARYTAASTSWDTIMNDLRANDYNYYTVGGTVILDLAVGDQIFAGYNNSYAGVALNQPAFNRFSMHKIG